MGLSNPPLKSAPALSASRVAASDENSQRSVSGWRFSHQASSQNALTVPESATASTSF
jgi:hypothetical protein